MGAAIDHTQLPFDEIIETRLQPGDYAGRTACRIMQDGFEMGVWIETGWEGAGPLARKILAVNDLLDACRQALLAFDDIDDTEGLSEGDSEVRNMLRAALAKATGGN